MAKTNWVLNEIVMPADMNQIGTEINAKAEINNTVLTGTETLGDRWCRRSLGTNFSLANSANQKIRISLPSLNFGGNIKLTVLGSYNVLNLNGIMEKSFTGNLIGSNKTFDGVSNYEKVFSTNQNANGFLNVCQISDLKSDSNGFFFEFCVSVSTASHVFSFFLEAKSSSGANLSDLIKGASLGNFYADTVVLPKAIVQERQLQLTAPQGTAPLVVTSTTRVDNLNADYHNGMKRYNSITDLQITIGEEDAQSIFTAMLPNSELTYRKTSSNTSTFYPQTFGLLKVFKKDDSASDFEFLRQEPNSILRFYKGSYRADVNPNWSGWREVPFSGSTISSSQLTSTAPQGTAPLVVTSTTKVDNLNADFVNGIKFYKTLSEISLTNETVSMDLIISALGVNQGIIFNTNGINAPRIGLNSADRGVVEIYKASTTLIVAEFNSIKSNTSTTSKQGVFDSNGVFQSWVELAVNGSPITSTRITSTAPQGTAPLVVTSTTKVNNLNSDLLDDMHADVNKTAITIVARKSDGGIDAGGFSSFEQIGVKLPGRNRELRLTQDANNISYIQLVNDSGSFISNPIQINSDGTAGFNVSTNVISYTNPATPQIRNTHVGNTAPSNSLGINGDIYIEL